MLGPRPVRRAESAFGRCCLTIETAHRCRSLLRRARGGARPAQSCPGSLCRARTGSRSRRTSGSFGQAATGRFLAKGGRNRRQFCVSAKLGRQELLYPSCPGSSLISTPTSARNVQGLAHTVEFPLVTLAPRGSTWMAGTSPAMTERAAPTPHLGSYNSAENEPRRTDFASIIENKNRRRKLGSFSSFPPPGTARGPAWFSPTDATAKPWALDDVEARDEPGHDG
jgi:hypothetical protein